MRIIYIVIGVVAIIGIMGNVTLQGNMDSTIQNIQTSVTTIAFAGELDEIKTSVNEFLVLRNIHNSQEGQELANKLDDRLNNLQLVKIYCDEEISTMDLANEKNPYEKLQQICPKLKEISFIKAVDLFKLI